MEMKKLVEVYLDRKAAFADAEAAFKEAEAAIKEALGDVTSMEVTVRKIRFSLTFKERKGAVRIDTAALKAAEPEIYSRYSVTGKPSRPLFVKPK